MKQLKEQFVLDLSWREIPCSENSLQTSRVMETFGMHVEMYLALKTPLYRHIRIGILSWSHFKEWKQNTFLFLEALAFSIFTI